MTSQINTRFKASFTNICIILLLAFCSNSSHAQGGKLDKNGKRSGSWEVVHSLPAESYAYLDPLNTLPNYLGSIQELHDNGEALIAAINRDIRGMAGSYFFVEQCKFDGGVRHGKFQLFMLQSTGRTNDKGHPDYNQFEMMNGSYSQGKLNGPISYRLASNEFVVINYTDGVINDQSVQLNPVPVKLGSGTINPVYTFSSGIMSEAVIVDSEGLPSKFVYNPTRPIIMRYTKKPIAYNQFSFLGVAAGQKDNVVMPGLWQRLNTAALVLEVVPLKALSNPLKTYATHGSYRLFEVGKTLFDTIALKANVPFVDNLRNGKATIWADQTNGKLTGSPLFEYEYQNDLLNGQARLYYPDGTISVEANFKQGIINGDLVAYHHASELPFQFETVIRYPYKAGGVISITQLGQYKETFQEYIKIIREHNGTVEKPNSHALYSQINYRLDSIVEGKSSQRVSVASNDFYYYFNERPVVHVVLDKSKQWAIKDVLFFDMAGTVVYSLNQANEELRIAAEKQAQENERFLNSTVTCSACSKPSIVRNSKQSWGGCDCFDRLGEGIGVHGTQLTFFCSVKCKIDFETDCCRRNGFNYYR